MSTKLLFASAPKQRLLKILSALCVLIGPLPSYAANDFLSEDYTPVIQNSLLHQNLQLVFKTNYALACNPYHRIASWVMFSLTQKDLDKTPRYKRVTGSYSTDMELQGACRVSNSEYSEYTKHGYDRGHLADAESFNGTSVGNQEVAITSNMTPQDLSFNRGIWAKLEKWQREQAEKEKHILVFVGPILDHKLPALKAGISIPEKFYKVIIDLTPPQKAIAFIIDQDDRGDFRKHWLCADEVEKQTGLEFANQVLGADKKQLFSSCDFQDWL